MALVVTNGALLKQGNALGTGQACCCNKCSGPCDEENPCPDGCECCGGVCQSEPCGCFRVIYYCYYDDCVGENPDTGPEIQEEKITELGRFTSSLAAQQFADSLTPEDLYCDPVAQTGPELFGQGFYACFLTSTGEPTVEPCTNPFP